jgi:hypothetical protein
VLTRLLGAPRHGQPPAVATQLHSAEAVGVDGGHVGRRRACRAACGSGRRMGCLCWRCTTTTTMTEVTRCQLPPRGRLLARTRLSWDAQRALIEVVELFRRSRLEHLVGLLDSGSADGTQRLPRLHQLVRTRLAHAQVVARHDDVVLGRVEAHHALLRIEVRPEARPAVLAPAASSASHSARSA